MCSSSCQLGACMQISCRSQRSLYQVCPRAKLHLMKPAPAMFLTLVLARSVCATGVSCWLAWQCTVGVQKQSLSCVCRAITGIGFNSPSNIATCARTPCCSALVNDSPQADGGSWCCAACLPSQVFRPRDLRQQGAACKPASKCCMREGAACIPVSGWCVQTRWSLLRMP